MSKTSTLLFTLFFSAKVLAQDESCIVDRAKIGLVDQAKTLKEIEQKNVTEGQCEKYQTFIDAKTGQLKVQHLNNSEALKAKVLCGKWIFFNLGMASASGVPIKLVRAMENFPDAGPRLAKLGLLDDASWAQEPFPFGFVPAKHKTKVSIQRIAAGKNVQLSCVACHTGKLPDGSFSVGAPNEQLDFGKFNALALYSIWLADVRKHDTTRWDPALIAYYKAQKNQKHTFMLRQVQLMQYMPANSLVLKYLIGEEPPGLGSQRSMLKSKPGVFNGFAPVLNFHDKELYISTPQIWGIGKYQPVHYGNLGGIKNVEDFISEAIVITTQLTKYSTKDILEPIKEYMKCLEAPKNPNPINLAAAQKGHVVFKNNCISCHDLPDGASTKAYTFEEMNAPSVYSNILLDYKPTDIQSQRTFEAFRKLGLDTAMTDVVRARRLNGIWTRKNLTFNGAIDDLDHLFCLNNKLRKKSHKEDPMSQGGHSDLCQNYTQNDKINLIEYLKGF